MERRSMIAGMARTGVVLLLLATGCAKPAPVTPEVDASGTTSDMTSDVSAEELARREQERRRAIAERERQMSMQSMRRGGPDTSVMETTLGPEVLQQHVHFAFDSAALSEEARTILEQQAAWLRANPGVDVVLEGHCDERGTTAYNLALGARRANAVERYLVALGIDSRRLTTISYGEERPLDPGHHEAAWARNRRVQFEVVGRRGMAGS